jgi:23S rRNA (cytosine1962-C5)-methyltransferase
MKEVLLTKSSKDYELLDSGEGEKLERFGAVVVRRPDPQVLWQKQLPSSVWNKADIAFGKGWTGKSQVPNPWTIEFEGKFFGLKLSSFKHVGIFPEQEENWRWIESSIRSAERPIRLLNLFAYTGGATLAGLKVGAEVCHVDGSKTAIASARENARLSGLEKGSVRWILDDALAFVKREIKREKQYDAIVMDPPAFGHGPKGEPWKIEEHFPELMSIIPQILSNKPLFVLVNGYASGYSALAYENCLSPLLALHGGQIESGEVALAESGGRALPAGIFARWSK